MTNHFNQFVPTVCAGLAGALTAPSMRKKQRLVAKTATPAYGKYLSCFRCAGVML